MLILLCFNSSQQHKTYCNFQLKGEHKKLKSCDFNLFIFYPSHLFPSLVQHEPAGSKYHIESR